MVAEDKNKIMKYEEDSVEQAYYDNVVHPFLERQSLEEWESRQANQE